MSAHPRDPYGRAPTDELAEPLLPRWFVLLCLALIPLMIAVVGAAVLLGRGEDIPVAARRPPPAGALTHDVGRVQIGPAQPEPYAAPCPTLEGVLIAGAEQDRSSLRRALAGICNTVLEPDAAEHLRRFAEAGGIIRFALFEATGVDSVAEVDIPPRILVNAKFTQTDPLWISPLVVHDATLLAHDPHLAESALAARRAEAGVCARILAGRRTSRGCEDAAALLALPDPRAALRAEGYR